MKALLTAKVGTFLVISSVLAVWTLLAAQHVRAHTTNLPTPSCSGLPNDTFFASANTAPITTGGVHNQTITPKQGTDLTQEGDLDFYYAKITVPALTAGELRVFDTEDGPSDAVLCHGSTPQVTSRTTYTRHDQASAIKSANDAAAKAEEARMKAAAAVVDTESKALTALTSARTALSSAATALSNAAKALRDTANAAHTTMAKDEAGVAARTAESDAQNARGVHAAQTGTPTQADPTTEDKRQAYNTARGLVESALETARTRLIAAADKLEMAATEGHVGFQIRAEVQPDDRSYILVASANAAPTLAVAFHGAISSAGSLNGAFGAGQSSSTAIIVTAPGLLTLEATGTTDTMGALDNGEDVEIAHADSGGSGGNFKLYVPVTANTDAYTLYVEGQTDTISGDYGLKMDFQVAMGRIAALDEEMNTITEELNWGTTDLPDDNIAAPAIQEGSDTDYFVFTIAADTAGLLTVQAEDGATSPSSDTTGTLYGPPGVEIAAATGGNGKHFRVHAPVQEMNIYAVQVGGTVGSYMLMVSLDAVEGTNGAPLPVTGRTGQGADGNCDTNDSFEICPPTGRNPAEREQHLFEVTEAGALYIHSTGGTDTIGTLFGPDGSRLATDDNSGQSNNFRLTVQVTPSLYLLEVRGKNESTRGAYELVTNFVAGEVVTTPTTPTTPGPGTEVTDLQARVGELEAELAACETPVETDATGNLGNPPDGGFRSGIGLISGWVCAANEVEVRIYRSGALRETLDVAYGTSRPDVPLNRNSNCTNANAGFGMTYNFNHLPEGEHTIRAYADDELIGEERTFEVVHIREFAPTDTDRFLTGLPAAECRVDDFPATGEDTFLLWEQSTQNFVIEDAG